MVRHDSSRSRATNRDDGDIDMEEWAANLTKLPKLHATMQGDVDPDWGTLKSYRTHEDHLALNIKLVRLCGPQQYEFFYQRSVDEWSQIRHVYPPISFF